MKRLIKIVLLPVFLPLVAVSTLVGLLYLLLLRLPQVWMYRTFYQGPDPKPYTAEWFAWDYRRNHPTP